jgi:hypothetical protein
MSLKCCRCYTSRDLNRDICLRNHLVRDYQGCSFGSVCKLVTNCNTLRSSQSVVGRSLASASRISPAAVLYALTIAQHPIFCIALKA